MSTKAAEARESFLRRLEQQQQQQQQQEQPQPAQEEDVKEETKEPQEDNTPQKENTEPTNADPSSPDADKKQSTNNDDTIAKTTPAPTNPTKNDPPATPPPPPPSNNKESLKTPSPPTQEEKAETDLLKSIIKSCGMNELSELNDVDPSSMKLLRALSTPRIGSSSRKKQQKKSSRICHSTSKKMQLAKETKNEEGKDAVKRALDFEKEGMAAVPKALPAAAKGEEKPSSSSSATEEAKAPPLNEIDFKETIPFNRQTSDLTAIIAPPKRNASITTNEDDNDDDDDIKDEETDLEVDINTEATTAGSKQEVEATRRSIRSKKKSSSLLPVATSSSSSSDVAAAVPDYETLEPWQRQLFDLLISQSKQIENMSHRIDNLSASLEQFQQQQQHQQQQQQQQRSQNNGWGGEGYEQYPPNEYPFQYSTSVYQTQQRTNAPAQSSFEDQQQQQQQPQTPLPPQRPVPHPQPPPHFIILPFLTKIVTFLLSAPNSFLSYLASTRIIRIFTAFFKEAQRRNDVHANLDVNLVFKLLLACFIFGGRSATSSSSYSSRKYGSNKKEDEDGMGLWELWEQNRVFIFACAAIVVYLIQTGILGFVYEFFVKGDYVQRIWRNEDLEEEQEGGGEENEEEGDGDGNEREGRENNQAVRRGGQDRVGGGPRNIANGVAGEEQRRRRTLADGGIRRHNEGFSFFHDAKYLVGGFFLSLLPTWRPELVEEEQEEEQPEQEVGGGGGGDNGAEGEVDAVNVGQEDN